MIKAFSRRLGMCERNSIENSDRVGPPPHSIIESIPALGKSTPVERCIAFLSVMLISLFQAVRNMVIFSAGYVPKTEYVHRQFHGT